MNPDAVRVCWLWFELKMLGYGYTLSDTRAIWRDEVLPALVAASGDFAVGGPY